MHLFYAIITVYKPVLGPNHIEGYLTKLLSAKWTFLYIFRMHSQISKNFVYVASARLLIKILNYFNAF